MKGRIIAFVIAIAGVGMFLVMSHDARIMLGRPDILGGPARVTDAHGDHVYFLSSQWEKKVWYSGSTSRNLSRRTVGYLHIDLWALDAQSAQPVMRRRLRTAKINGDEAALGIEDGVMWARIPDLVAIRLSDGAILADVDRIGAANPALADLLPRPPAQGIFLTQSMQPIKFTRQQGLTVMLADARRMHIDPHTLLATAVGPSPEIASAETPWHVIPSMAHGMEWRVLLRGQTFNRKDTALDWVGLVAAEEVAEALRLGAISETTDYSHPTRYRLYRGLMKAEEDFFGTRWRLQQLLALPESPEFLMGGLLIGAEPNGSKQQAMMRSDPNSLFVLARDRIDAAGTLSMARILASGKPAWTTELKLSALSGWLPGETHAVMFGPYDRAERSPMAEPDEDQVMQVRSIDLRTGVLNSFNLDLHRDWPAEPIATLADD